MCFKFADLTDNLVSESYRDSNTPVGQLRPHSQALTKLATRSEHHVPFRSVNFHRNFHQVHFDCTFQTGHAIDVPFAMLSEV